MAGDPLDILTAAVAAIPAAHLEPTALIVGGLAYPLDTDTKVLAAAFERAVRPAVAALAAALGATVVVPAAQNHYPDFTLAFPDGTAIAVDVKSTFRRWRADRTWRASFTLGSYTSYLRRPTKNIVLPYDRYHRHIVLACLYDRADTAVGAPVPAEQAHTLASPVRDVACFAADRHTLASDRPGSGNTANIGSIEAATIAGFLAGGPFAAAGGEALFHRYWANYGPGTFTDLAAYRAWDDRPENGPAPTALAVDPGQLPLF